MPTRLLIVEDQTRLAAAMAASLRASGFDVGAYPSVALGLDAIGAHGVQMAILDINVEDGFVYPLADELDARGIPYAFCSSMHPGDVPARHARVPFLRKPFDIDELVAMAAGLEDRLAQDLPRADHQDAPASRSGR